MKKVLRFVVPPNESKMEGMKFAEELLTKVSPWRKAFFAQDDGDCEIGIFFESANVAFGAVLHRDAEGKIIDGYVGQFTGVDAMEWFHVMFQSLLR